MQKLTDRAALTALMPSSIARDTQIKAATDAVSPWLTALTPHLQDALTLYRLDDIKGTELDHLARQWYVTVWRDTWSDTVKRRVLRELIGRKRRAGTLHAVKKAIEVLGSAGVIREWWQCNPPRRAHTFEVLIDQSSLDFLTDDEVIDDLIRAITAVKPVRSQFSFTIMQKGHATLYLSTGGAAQVTSRIGIHEYERKRAGFTQPFYVTSPRGRPTVTARISNFSR